MSSCIPTRFGYVRGIRQRSWKLSRVLLHVKYLRSGIGKVIIRQGYRNEFVIITIASCCIRNYRNIFIVYSHHSYVICTEGVNDIVMVN